MVDAATEERKFLARLRAIVGSRHLLTDPGATKRYRTGYRFGEGPVLAVVRPGTLVEMWRVLSACVAADKVVIVQAANTGLTGGSTPHGDGYDRDVVLVSTSRLAKIHLIEGGRQVICLPGATLNQLEAALAPLGREPHSVIGSSCIGASVIGGVCNNSGGALVRRGPAYTELALYASADADGGLHLVNHLGIRLGDDPETMLAQLERGDFGASDVQPAGNAAASDADYAAHVRQVDAPTPARFNADPRRLFEASGSAGRLAVFAVRLDSFASEGETQVFYIGTNDPAELTALRRDMLRDFAELPVAAEYMHAHAFDIAECYGRDTFLLIRWLGTARLPKLFAAKAWCDRAAERIGSRGRNLSDRLLHKLGRLFPRHLPKRLIEFRARYEHHLLLKVTASMAAETETCLRSRFPSSSGDFFACTRDEGDAAFLHRFAAAGAAVRYRAVHRNEVEDIVALDIALRRNDAEWFETLPPELASLIVLPLYYGHFFCHVFHQDYIVRKGCDPHALEEAMLALLDRRGAEYPAEHNVGHLYAAKPALAGFYRSLDPGNRFNPGIGKTSKLRDWR